MDKQIMIKLVKTYKNGEKVIVEVPEEHAKLLLKELPEIFSHPSKEKSILGKDYSMQLKKDFNEELLKKDNIIEVDDNEDVLKAVKSLKKDKSLNEN